MPLHPSFASAAYSASRSSCVISAGIACSRICGPGSPPQSCGHSM
jgi:hypothetical protein